MYSFKFIYGNYDIPFNKYMALEIFEKTYGKIKIKIFEDLNLNKNSYKNIFIYDDNEINITKLSRYEYKVDIFPLPKSNEFVFVFGCELETCISLSCLDKKGEKELENIKQLIPESKDDIVNLWIEEHWIKLVRNYLENLFPSKNFVKYFPIIKIATKPKSGFVNYEYNFLTKKFREVNELIDYEYIILTRDSSLICGDNFHLKNMSGNIIKNIDKSTFHCEIITPILYNLDIIKVLYKTLFKKSCFIKNESAGFHINVSLISGNVISNNPIYWSQGFIDCFLKYFEKYEKKNYKKLRPLGSEYAKELLDYAKKSTSGKIQKYLSFKDMKYINTNFDIGEKLYKCLIDLNDKYISFHIKNPIVAEFRLFPSQENKDELFSYIDDTYKIIKNSIDDYYNNHIKIVKELQRKYSAIEFDFNDLEYYNNYLYYEDSRGFINKLETPSENERNLIKGLKYLFSSREQKFLDIENNIITVLNIEDNEMKYSIKFLNDGMVEIILLK